MRTVQENPRQSPSNQFTVYDLQVDNFSDPKCLPHPQQEAARFTTDVAWFSKYYPQCCSVPTSAEAPACRCRHRLPHCPVVGDGV